MTKAFVDYEQPPVVETVFGVVFQPLREWQLPHFGLLWNKLRPEYPEFSVQPPVSPEGETETQTRIDNPTINDLARCWFIDNVQGRLVQVQRDRFMHNWRQHGARKYPRYDRTSVEFQKAWGQFLDFLREYGISGPNVVRCELTYLNHFERGTLWSTLSDLPRLISVWSGVGSEGFLPAPELVDFDLRYAMPPPGDRLNVQFRRAKRQEDDKEILQLTLTARGTPKSGAMADLFACFDIGHEWITRGFTDLTALEAHRVWGRQR